MAELRQPDSLIYNLGISRHMAKSSDALHPKTWVQIIKNAYALFDDLEERGFGTPPFSLGGGTVLMLDYKHRLSKDVDLFTYDAQWLSLLSPRLNDKAAALATSYTEQSNIIKIEMPYGDIDFVVAADVTAHEKARLPIAGREFSVDPPSEILAKKLFYRAANFQPRDVYDMSAVIDLAPQVARKAAIAAAPKRDLLVLRLNELAEIDPADLIRGIVPYDGTLQHAKSMMAKVRDFIVNTVADRNRAEDEVQECRLPSDRPDGKGRSG